MVHAAARLSLTAHRGPTFLDFPLDVFGPAAGDIPDVGDIGGATPDALPANAGLWLTGRLEAASLTKILDLQWSGPRGRPLQDWLSAPLPLASPAVPRFLRALGPGILPPLLQPQPIRGAFLDRGLELPRETLHDRRVVSAGVAVERQGWGTIQPAAAIAEAQRRRG